MPAELRALIGTSPLGLLTSLGALDVLDRSGSPATLRWLGGLSPHAELGGTDAVAELIALIDSDLARWRDSPILQWPAEQPLADLRLDRDVLRDWAAAVLATGDRADLDLFCALAAEGALAGKGDSKPTHLHFTAGQQRFLDMVRHLANGVQAGDLEEALVGPWRYESTLPTLGWDARGERIYALRATDPSKEKRPGVPGADWLAFLGMSAFPVVNHRGVLHTRACSPAWKRGWLRWPLWDAPLSGRVVRSLLGDPMLASQSPSERRARGVTTLLQAPIRRTDQGGYGSFGPASLVPPAAPKASPTARTGSDGSTHRRVIRT